MQRFIEKSALIALSALVLAWGPSASADDGGATFTFNATASGAQQMPGVDSDASAKVVVRFDRGLTQLRVVGRIKGLESAVAAAHFHCGPAGTNAPVAFGILSPGPLNEIGDRFRVTLDNDNYTGVDCTPTAGRPVNNVASLYFAMRAGAVYLNIHTVDFPGGELRGQMIPRK